MIINHKYKFIFIHIPRTGGISTREALEKLGGSVVYDQAGWKHIRGKIVVYGEPQLGPLGPHEVLTEYINKADLKNADTYFKWARVRNPWDRLVSIYNRRRNTVRWYQTGTHPAQEAIDNPFEAWVEIQINTTKPPWRHRVFNQRRFIKDQGLDFVSRFENINEDFSFFCDKVGLPQIKLPHKNGWKHNSYKEYYNKKLIDKLLSFDSFREDLDYLNYDYQP